MTKIEIGGPSESVGARMCDGAAGRRRIISVLSYARPGPATNRSVNIGPPREFSSIEQGR